MTNPLNPLYDAVAWVMEQIHTGLSTFLPPAGGLTWVLTIVILVVLMRLLLVPLFVKQMHATRKMTALAPQIQELRKKYKNDKQTLNQETMKLYKENGANPLAGCLPLLGQMPLFFAYLVVTLPLVMLLGLGSGIADLAGDERTSLALEHAIDIVWPFVNRTVTEGEV